MLYTFTPITSYVCFLNVERSNLVFFKTYKFEFDDIAVTFTDQIARLLEI